jgi:hypothetical protein
MGGDRHQLHDLCHQEDCSVVVVFLYTLGANATNIAVQGASVWAAGDKNLLGQGSGKFFSLTSAWPCRQVDILLEDLITSKATPSFQDLETSSEPS